MIYRLENVETGPDMQKNCFVRSQEQKRQLL